MRQNFMSSFFDFFYSFLAVLLENHVINHNEIKQIVTKVVDSLQCRKDVVHAHTLEISTRWSEQMQLARARRRTSRILSELKWI